MKKTARAIVAAWGIGVASLVPGPAAAQEPAVDWAWSAQWDRMTQAGRRSSDLRVRIVYSLGDLERRGGVDRFSEAIPVETLVEQARGSTDPVVLSLLVDRCFEDLDKAGKCDAVDLARRWTVADTQNQLAWIALSTVLGKHGDPQAARVAFRRAALASRWHEYYPEVARLLVPIAPKAIDPATRTMLLLMVLSKSWTGLPSSHYQTINNRCKEADLHDACGRILDTMARDAQSMMTLNVATGLAQVRNALPSTTVSAIRQRREALWWAASQCPGLTDEEMSIPAIAQQALAHVEALIAQNEVEVLSAILLASGVSESVAAQRYVATLSPEQLAYRNNGPQTVTPAPH